jgi:23S rRNA U2552 (ribose-2'-O)-methylase RlmE/FtsJ
MLSWIIQISIISIIFIFLVHHLIGFFKTTLTVPKVKDLVNSPSQKYQYMFDTISKTDQSMSEMNYTAIDLLPTEHQSNLNTISIDAPTKDVMKDELKNFLKKQMNTANSM